MSKPWIFISPSSRGLGYAVTRHLLRRTTLPILSTARGDPGRVKASLVSGAAEDGGGGGDHLAAEDLAPRLHVVQLDVTDEASVAAAAERAAALFPPATHHLHLGLAGAGVLFPEKNPRQIDYAHALQTVQVNLLGPLLLMKWFGEFLPRKATELAEPPSSSASSSTAATPGQGGGQTAQGQEKHDGGSNEAVVLPRHATFVSVSARVGSTTDNRAGGWYSYRASKAGVTSLSRTLDRHLLARSGANAIAVAYHPGTVRTDLSRDFWAGVPEGRLFSPEYAAERLLDVVCTRRADGDGHRGRFWDWKGDEILP
jgi:NAD(P)-dependent dehydrogenase (short-subunit alcohol dehydrogenase family)